MSNFRRQRGKCNSLTVVTRF